MTRGDVIDAVREDAEARALARTEFRRPLVLEAGAGTGKTSALVSRIVFWLLGPGWERAAERVRAATGASAAPRADAIAGRAASGVVAITFTDAAAAEMAKRVGEALHAIARRDPLPPGVAPPGFDVPEEWPGRARALHDALDQLVLRTIHAFCRRLLVAHPIEAGLHPRFEIDADLRVRDEVVRAVVEGGLRRAWAEPSDPTWLALAARGVGAAALEAAVRELVEKGVPADAIAGDPLAPEWTAALRDALRGGLARFVAADGGRLARVKGSAAVNETAELVLETLARVDAPGAADRGAFDELVAWVRERWSKRIGKLGEWARGEFGKGAAAALGPDLPAVRDAAGGLRGLVAHVLDLDLDLLAHAWRALAPLLAETEAELRARGAVTFAGLLRQARDLLARHPAVAERERARIDQLLVDEFQDTDLLQCDLVGALALEGPEDRRPGLFVVGDPKQSIYGWRNADLAAYDGFVERVERAGGERRLLSVNHRSVPAVLEEVERVIAPVLQEQRGVQPAFQRLVADAAGAARPPFAHGDHAPIEHWISCAVDAETGAPRATRVGEAAALEAAALARDLASLHVRHGVPWRKVAVLFRSYASVDVYLEALREAGIPYDVAGDRSYYQRREIVEAAALVRCVLDPHDHVALLAHLRSALAGVPDAAWIPLWTPEFLDGVTRLAGPDDEPLAQVAAAVRAAAEAVAGDVPGLERIPGWDASLRAALRVVAELRASFARDPSDTFVRRMRALTQIDATEAARHLGAYRVANLDRFFRELSRALCEGADVATILRGLRAGTAERPDAEEGRPTEALEDAVTVTSIHKAKGLDFDHVYLVEIHKTAGPRRSDGDVCLFRNGAWELRLLGAPSLGFHAALADRDALEAAERVRTLYVAMTRARDRLVLAGLRPGMAGASARESHAALLAERRDGPALDALVERLTVPGAPAFLDAGGARWRLTAACADRAGVALPRVAEVESPVPAAVAEESEELARLREEARAHAARPIRGAASALAHEALRETLEAEAAVERGPARDGRPEDRAGEVARAVGTAVHRALEEWSPEAPAAAQLARLRDVMAGTLAALLPAAETDGALDEACALLRTFADGPLAARLAALAPDVVARELPVLAPPGPGDDGPVGFVAGAIDLLYRDRVDRGRLVVADYKTDRVADASEIEEKKRAYAGQGRVYARAVRDALGLAYLPRFELWLLRTAEVLPVPIDA